MQVRAMTADQQHLDGEEDQPSREEKRMHMGDGGIGIVRVANMIVHIQAEPTDDPRPSQSQQRQESVAVGRMPWGEGRRWWCASGKGVDTHIYFLQDFGREASSDFSEGVRSSCSARANCAFASSGLPA